ncbi:hypothetical protein, partial [Halococcus hamelinensis]
ILVSSVNLLNRELNHLVEFHSHKINKETHIKLKGPGDTRDTLDYQRSLSHIVWISRQYLADLVGVISVVGH